MEKNIPPEYTRKSIYVKISVAKKIKLLAKKENRTFSSFVALLLESAANQKGEKND